jgi:putative membrane protein insertion efficiency factor
MPNLAVFLLKGLIRLYQIVLSPWLGTQCRFTPTCSCYMHTALEHHGFWKGTALGLWRILRCHPFYQGAWYDPVPERFAWRALFRYNQARITSLEEKHQNES